VSDLALHPAIIKDALTAGGNEPVPADLQTSFTATTTAPAVVTVTRRTCDHACTGRHLTAGLQRRGVQWLAPSIQPPNVLYSNGTVILDGAVLETPSTYSAPYTLNFTAKFDGGAFQHIGFATDLSGPPWAIISTGAAGDGIYARTNPTVGVAVDTLIGTTALFGVLHDFSIEWSDTGFKYFIDGVQHASHALPETTPMKILGSDSSRNGNVITITTLDELTL
jgi:hypothetical protein